MSVFKYTFTPSERDILDVISEWRYKETSKHGEEASQNSQLSAFEKTRRGVYSEYAASKYLNLHFNLDCSYRDDFGADLVTRSGITIDVKCTHYANGGIAAVPWSGTKEADIFIGSYAPLDLSYVELFGYVKRENLITASRVQQTKQGNREYYFVPRNEVVAFNEQRH